MTNYHSRYQAYARAHARTAEDQHAYDRARYGASLHEYVLWNSVHWEMFAAAIGAPMDTISDRDYLRLRGAEYDEWLARKYPAVRAW